MKSDKESSDAADSEPEVPLSQVVQRSSRKNSSSNRNPVTPKMKVDDDSSNSENYSSSDSDSEDIPLSKVVGDLGKSKAVSLTNSNNDRVQSNGRGSESESDDDEANINEESDFEDDVPLAKKTKTPAKPKSKKRKGSDNDDEIKTPKKKKPTSLNPKPKAEPKTKTKTKVKTENEKNGEEEPEEYKWWLDDSKDDGVKWTTLEHAGPLFPPPYKPHNIKMKYEGVPVTLTPAAEEVASFFAALIKTDYASNTTFCRNFFTDFLSVINEEKMNKCPIKKFEDCDFTPIFDYLETLKEAKKLLTKEDKKAIKLEKQAVDDQYGFCLLDDRKEKVGNFRIEPPGLFRGRGEHPKTGCLKMRVRPEQVTINIGTTAKVPPPPPGTKWGAVTHDNAVTWLAMWKENVNDNTKYVFLAANSSLKGQSDMKKFEKARELKKHIEKIRESYTSDLKNEVMATRQLATSLYFIDKLALRAGNEKGEDEADTVGCCSLRYEHLTLEPPNLVIFDFLGKDSIRYVNKVEVTPQVFKNLKIFKKPPKVEGDDLFDRINTSLVNKHLTQFMPGLTAKVFRTYNASITFQQELLKTPENASIAEKVLAYNRANREVAVLCNHQRAVPKSHGQQMSKLNDKILAIKYERQLVKKALLKLDPSFKKKRPELSENESDLDDDFIKRHSLALDQKEIEKNEKALLKANEKLKEEGGKPITKLPGERLETGEAFQREIEKISAMTEERLEKKLVALTDSVIKQKTLLVDKDENKQTALGTSKINYIDPRITSAWCDKHNVPLEKMFTKTLRDKFKWAMDTKSDFVF